MGVGAKRLRECIICKAYCPAVGFRYHDRIKYIFYCENCNKRVTLLLEELPKQASESFSATLAQK